MTGKFKHQTDAIRENVDAIAEKPYTSASKVPAEVHAMLDLIDLIDGRQTRLEEIIGKIQQ